MDTSQTSHQIFNNEILDHSQISHKIYNYEILNSSQIYPQFCNYEILDTSQISHQSNQSNQSNKSNQSNQSNQSIKTAVYTSASPYSFAVFLYVTSSNIMIFLLRVLNVLHKIAMVTFLWLTLNWLHDLSNDIHERCHDKPLHDRQHEWPHWQYHDRPKLWYQGSFGIL